MTVTLIPKQSVATTPNTVPKRNANAGLETIVSYIMSPLYLTSLSSQAPYSIEWVYMDGVLAQLLRNLISLCTLYKKSIISLSSSKVYPFGISLVLKPFKQAKYCIPLYGSCLISALYPSFDFIMLIVYTPLSYVSSTQTNYSWVFFYFFGNIFIYFHINPKRCHI